MATPHDANNQRPLEPAPDSPEAEQAAANPRGWLGRNGPFLLTLVAAFLLIHFYFGVSWETWRSIAIAAVGLGLVIFIHELGHFAVAKWCDVHVETFSIGFGPPLPGCCFRWGETLYKIAVFPFGGYVRMVGEGAEADDSDSDPRSFKNKSVWQRMAIISAGVTMNLILAFCCFVFVFRTHGDEQMPGTIGKVAAGSPLWKVGGRSGDVIYRLGGQDRPTFEELTKLVTNSTAGEALDIVFGPPGAAESDRKHKQIAPRKDADDPKPFIGVVPANQPRLPPAKYKDVYLHPVRTASAAARAEPAFAFGDAVVATTDPEHPGQLLELPPDPENPQHRDYFAFHRRLRRLAGKEMVVQVDRPGQGAVSITVPPAYHYTLGARMRMGKITAVRDDSPAAKAGVQPGDIIEKVEVAAPNGKQDLQPAGVDPLRLPYDLTHWAAGAAGAREVTLTVVRTTPPPTPAPDHHERERIPLTMGWDTAWEDDVEVPSGSGSPSPMALPGLGIAYAVETTIEGVQPDSPAAKAGLRERDVIKEILYYQYEGKDARKMAAVKKKAWLGLGPDKELWVEIEPDQWAVVFYGLQMNLDSSSSQAPKIGLRVARPKATAGEGSANGDGAAKPETVEVTLDLQEDRSWPTEERGLVFLMDERIRKADSLGQALIMGVNKSFFYVDMILGNLRGLATRRLSPKIFGGPITIGWAAFRTASESIYKFLIFLGIIGVNLAVVNFLPIPVLDGGHMVFLIYEKLRGRPAPERVRVAASLVGVTLILALMGFVIYLDLSRLLG